MCLFDGAQLFFRLPERCENVLEFVVSAWLSSAGCQRAVSAEEMGVQKKGGLLQERYGGLVRPASEQQQLVQPAALLGLPNGSVRADSLP